MIKIIKWHADERVDLPDAEQFGGEMMITENTRMLREMFMPEGRATGYAATEGRVFSGFDIPTSLPAATVTINRGTGIFKILRDGVLSLGMLLGDNGSASQTIDLAGNGADDYAIYVRAVYTDTDKENRVHWDDAGTQEIVLFENTRSELIWEWTYRSTSASVPSGGDWMKVWELTWDGAAVQSRSDCRHLYFEGSNHPAVPPLAAEWGAGNDRNVNRGSYGVRDFNQWVSAMRQKIHDIQGAYYNWFAAPLITLSDLDNEHWGSVQFGKHRQVTFGDAGEWWKLYQVSAFSTQAAILQALDASNGGIMWEMNDFVSPGNRHMIEYMIPYNLSGGGSADLINGDKVTRQFGLYWNDEFEKVGATQMIRRFGAPATAPDEVLFKMGNGYSSTLRGVTVGDLAGYHLSSRSAYMLVDLAQMTGGGDWLLVGSGGIDIVTNALHWVTSTAVDTMFGVIHDFPQWCTLEQVNVYWHQAASGGGAGSEMRMVVGRVTHDMKTAKTAVGEIQSRSSLSTVADYVDYVYAAGAKYRVSVFTCDQNNTSLRRGEDEIHLGFRAAAGGVACHIYAVMLKFTFTEACPFPLF